jgi:hypothetical protein
MTEQCSRHSWFKRLGLTLTAFLAIVVAVGCVSPKQAPDPLEGWKSSFSQNPNKIPKAVRDDYQDYIQQLPTAERRYVIESNIWFLEDGSGRHAVRIAIPINGVWWQHVLIYDIDNKRIRATKYKSGGYRS